MDVQGQWNMTQGLTIGSLGTGAMTIEGGGAVASGDGDIGLARIDGHRHGNRRTFDLVRQRNSCRWRRR